MTRKKWICIAAAALALALAAWVGGNLLADPFGVFGDPILHWYGYNASLSPGTAKPAWLEQHRGEYDSFVLGPSSAGAYDVERLNEYLDARFYNLCLYDCGPEDYRTLAAYLLEKHPVNNLVLSLDIGAAGQNGGDSQLHALVSGESLPLFYLRYAFRSPVYSLEKLSARQKDTILPQPFDVFDAQSGCFDRRQLDVEKIGDTAVYQAAHNADFACSAGTGTAEPDSLEAYVQTVADIRDMCEARGVNLIVIVSPVYSERWETYSEESLRTFLAALAQEVDYWNFSSTSVSLDSRYFYDDAHFRGAVGDMMLAEMFGDGTLYCPADFGTLVTAETCESHLERLFTNPPEADTAAYTVDVPILLYHHITPDAADDTTVSQETLEWQMQALAEAGYHAVTAQELINYVYHGGSLPEKPVFITFDDGYYSNYEIAWPILERYGMKATIFCIGVSMGHMEYYKDTEYRLTPHFGYDEAREMMNSGVIDIQSHTYDMHQWAPFETGDKIRPNVLPLAEESETEYAAALTEDMDIFQAECLEELGDGFCSLAYPSGLYTDLTEVLVHENGIPLTLSTRTDSRNVLVRGLPQSLYALCRWYMTEQTTLQELMDILQAD